MPAAQPLNNESNSPECFKNIICDSSDGCQTEYHQKHCFHSVQFQLVAHIKWHGIIFKQNNASWRDTTGDPEGTKVIYGDPYSIER